MSTNDSYPKDPQSFIEHCKALSYDDLRELRYLLEAEVVSLTNTIKHNERLCITDGSEGRAIGAMGWSRWRLSTASQILTAKRPRIADCFVDAARLLLPKETFTSILNEAKAAAANIG